MKVVHVINNFSHTSIPVEMADLMAQKETVDIISLCDLQETAEEMSKMYAIHCRKIYGCGYKCQKTRAVNLFRKLICEGDYDIIQTHHSLSGYLASKYMYGKSKAKIVTTIHGNRHSYNFKQNLIASYTLRNVDAIAYNSDTTKKSLLWWQRILLRKNTKHQVIYNGVNLRRINECNNSSAFDIKTKYRLPDDAFIIVQVGRLEPVKNAFASVKGFESYLKSNPADKNIYFVIVGDGSERTAIEQYINNSAYLRQRVIMTGLLRREEVYSLMHHINLQIIPSHFEGFCNALFESLSLGNQVIVSDILIFKELLSNVTSIPRFNPKNYDELASCIKTIRQQEPQENERKIYIDVASNFSTEVCVDHYLKLYNEIIG